MINRIEGRGSYELVLSKDECCYQDVLDDFLNASEICILTYNISRKNEELLELLNDVNEDVSICIITNIPSRFERYFYQHNRNSARNNISYYLAKLDPETYSTSISTYFNFNNHSKIIMTDNIAYIGSANYSSESSDNFECGFITRDTEIINQIRENFFGTIEEESVRYYGTELTRLEVLFMSFYTRLKTISNNIYEGAFWEDDRDVQHYNSINPYISSSTIEGIGELIVELQEIQTEWQEDKLFLKLISFIDIDNIKRILQMCDEDHDLNELANFDDQDYMDNYLEEHALEAYDEYLDEYAQRASDEAAEILWNLAGNAEDSVNELYHNVTSFLGQLEIIIEHISELKDKDNTIDNT